MKENKIYSYTSASVFPVKLLQNKPLNDIGNIKLKHVQISITNKCNLKCSFCSCSKRDKNIEASLSDINQWILKFSVLGCEAVTITGGGEPLNHPYINEVISLFVEEKIKIGLVTNGLLLKNLSSESIKNIDWIRISFDDSRDFIKMEEVLQNIDFSTSDWAFSYVLSRKINWDNLQNIVHFANRNHFTHVRLVSDLLDLKHIQNMGEMRIELKKRVEDSLVIYQGRKDYTKGNKKCLISLLKPVIYADGSMYPCCGEQYTENEKDMCMGNINQINTIYQKQTYFNGEGCKKCYYSEYNEVLEALTEKVVHKEFV